MVSSLRKHITINVTLSPATAASLVRDPNGAVAQRVKKGLGTAVRSLEWIDRLEAKYTASGLEWK
jgi:hypothetical protein